MKDNLNPLMSAKISTWETPPDLFSDVDDIFGFELDVAAMDGNQKCADFISPEMDAFKTPWWLPGVHKANCWLNPPYSEGEKKCGKNCKKKKCVERGSHIDADVPGLSDWVARVVDEVEIGHAEVVVMLVPARTETEWFQGVWDKATAICFLRSRVKFVGAKDVAPFPSVLAVFGELTDAQREALRGYLEENVASTPPISNSAWRIVMCPRRCSSRCRSSP